MATLKRSDSIADNMPEALKQSRYHMKRCFAKYIEKGRRTMKLQQLLDEMENFIDDQVERTRVLQGLLGDIWFSIQVCILVISLLVKGNFILLVYMGFIFYPWNF
jgi:sucrose synthase